MLVLVPILQPKLFADPIENNVLNAFYDMPGFFNAQLYIEMQDNYVAYPEIWDANAWLQPDQMDGIIEVFDIRRTFSNTSIIDLLHTLRQQMDQGVHLTLQENLQFLELFQWAKI